LRRSGTFQESEIEGCEYEDDSHVHRQPFPDSVSKEQQIDHDDHGCHAVAIWLLTSVLFQMFASTRVDNTPTP
jgi:hypothetical protein